MITRQKVKDPSGWGADESFSKAINTTKFTPSHHKIKTAAKRSIVTLAVWGLIPANFAMWLIQRGGLKNV